MQKLTDEQMIEICRSRERLREYRDKIQPYPAYPLTVPEPPQEQVIVHRHSNMGKQEYDLLQQTALRLTHWEDKLTTHLEPKQKTKPPTYKGLTT